MKINEIIALADSAYPDGMIADHWSNDRKRPRKGSGDTLAQFIVLELYGTFDPRAAEEDQIKEAIRVLDMAMSDIGGVRHAFLQRRRECEQNTKATQS